MLPMASEIISCLKEANSPGSVSGVLKELGDILLITTARATQKIYFPLLLCFYMWSKKGNGFQWRFSGSPMLKLYNSFAKDVKFRMRSGASPLLTSEAIFHAMFGTYLEDLSILQQITNHPKFHQRKDMNSIFLKRSEKNPIFIAPIQFKYVSKMAQALLTKSLNIDPVSTSKPSFSGFRKRTFTQEFLSYLSTGKSAINYSSDPMQ
ncbi:jg18711 [Pararge aegeria aegeria]|uniref:Jg18711 protein n=1 Tax=Pararge aegeria aegeria TaxID=348720 RepID=A0A8S4RZ31_9NEOP|nr:jg18711 [Pararge aegeria aegeria]